jgi:hypothetical protein
MQYLFGKTDAKTNYDPANAFNNSKIELSVYYLFRHNNPGYPYKDVLNFITQRRYSNAVPCEIDYGYLLNQQIN